MKKCIIVAVVSACLGAAGMLLLIGGVAKVAADCPGPRGSPCANGDVNGSGDIDLGDAIYVLTYLFGKGPRPEPIVCAECPTCDSCCPPAPPPSVIATGQTDCYDTAGNRIDCTRADCPGQDGFYQKGYVTEVRFVDNQDGTVTDNSTGLMWQRVTAPGTYTWQGGLLYCENLTLGDYGDWRLPNVRELHSLVDYGRYNLSIDPIFASVSGWYWSSSTDVYFPTHAWDVNFFDGYVYGDDKGAGMHVRAVRDAR